MKPFLPSQAHKHGLIRVKPKRRDLIRGTKRRLGGTPIQPDGNWTPFLPPDEVQNLAVEPMACTTFSVLNAVEMLERRLYGDTTNWSDRFLAKMSGTTKDGNDPNKVCETLRKKGCVYESEWPYTTEINTWDKFYAAIPYSVQVDAVAAFKGKYKFGHQWCPADPIQMMKALTFSPLTVGVWAWQFDPNTGYAIRPQGFESEHYTLVYAYENGRYWNIFDSYDQTHKKAAWDFGFDMLKEYTLDLQILDDETLWDKAVRWLQQFLPLQ